MSKIRLWKLGSLEHKLFPTELSVAKLAEVLLGAKAGEDGFIDIIWGPDLTVEVVEGDVDVIVRQLEDGNQEIKIVPRD